MERGNLRDQGLNEKSTTIRSPW